MRRLLLLLLFATSLSAKLVENVVARSDATMTYTLYLPTSYDAAKKYPLLLVFDPRGRGTKAAEVFRDAAEEYGWIIISSNQTASDDPNAPNDRAVRALLAEINRYATDPKRIYATGFSGTALLASGVGIQTHMLAGVIGVGGRLISDSLPAKFNFAYYGFAGERDFNNREMRMIDDALEGVVPHRFQAFDGVHQWMPPELAREALGWFEVLAGKPREKIMAEDVAAAEKLTGLAALRRWQAIHRTYGGFEDRIAKLEGQADVQRELADEKKWDEFEARYINDVFARIGSLLAPIRATDDPRTADIERVFRLPELHRRAKRPGAEGATAKRLIEAVRGQTGFYLPREFEARNEHAMADALRRVVASLAPPSQ